MFFTILAKFQETYGIHNYKLDQESENLEGFFFSDGLFSDRYESLERLRKYLQFFFND